jgi:hypothetical protein
VYSKVEKEKAAQTDRQTDREVRDSFVVAELSQSKEAK